MADNESGGELAPIDQEDGLAISIPPILDPRTNLSPVWFSVKPKTDADRAVLMASLTGQQPKLSSLINKEVEIQDVAFQGVMLTDKDTGERFSAVRSILFTPTGESYAAVSEGVRQGLGYVMQLWGLPPWKPAIPFYVRQLELKGGRRFYYLEHRLVTMPTPGRMAE